MASTPDPAAAPERVYTHDVRFPLPKRMVFRFELAGEGWNWPVEGDDSIRAFRELLMLARIPYTVSNA